MGELAVANADVANATGGLTADADAGEDGIGECAVGDCDVLSGVELSVSFGAAAGFERDAVVASGDVAAVDENVLAGVDIDAIAVSPGRSNIEVLDNDVLAAGGVQRPHEVVAGGEVLETEAVAVDGLDESRMTERRGWSWAATERGIADNFSGADDTGVIGSVRVDQGSVALNPFTLPADLGDGVIIEVRGSGEGSVLIETE